MPTMMPDAAEKERLVERLSQAGLDADVLRTAPLALLKEVARIVGDKDDEIGRLRALLPQESAPEDGEVAQVEQHVERFSENFERFGQTPASVAAGYRAARKARPGLTAAEFLGTKR